MDYPSGVPIYRTILPANQLHVMPDYVTKKHNQQHQQTHQQTDQQPVYQTILPANQPHAIPDYVDGHSSAMTIRKTGSRNADVLKH